ncbi:MAG: hypothetical protein J4A00_08955 [Gammaproteobacteria bacterium]|nr:hypothetical protein [Gammaproteobacteria bacterium]
MSKAAHLSSVASSLVRLLLAFALVFAAVHVALHEVDLGSDGAGGYVECQACRFDQTPAADLLPPALFVPLLLLGFVITVAARQQALSRPASVYLARGPPLF